MRPRRQVPAVLAGVVVGMLVTGLLVPLTFGGFDGDEPAATRRPAGTVAGPLGDGDDGTGPGGTGDGTTTTLPAGVAGRGPGAPGAGPTDPGSGAATGGATGAAAGAALAASDVGVTADTVKLGVVLSDLGGVGNLGIGFSLGNVPRQYQVFADEVNAAGGIHGRKIALAVRTWDPVNNSGGDSQLAACSALTQDEKVFAVLNTQGFVKEPVFCFTVQHRTPLVLGFDAASDDYYARSNGLLFSLQESNSRSLRALAAELHRTGRLTGKRIGIVSDPSQNDGTALTLSALIPALEGRGYTVTHHARLSEDSAASQIPLEVRAMSAKDVDVVILVTNLLFAAQWVQQSERQQFTPAYVTSDVDGGTQDAYGQGMPGSFEGAVGLTIQRTGEHRQGRPEPAMDADCKAAYSKATGAGLARGSGEYASVMQVCTMVRTFARAARAAGPDLTRERWSAAMQAIGPLDVAFTGGGEFGPGRFDAVDGVRFVSWSTGCKCWLPLDEFRRVVA